MGEPTDERTTDRRGASSDARPTRRRRVLEGAAGVGLGTVATTGAGGERGRVAADAAPEDDVDAADADDDESEPAALPLIDAHTHLIPEETLGREPLSADDLVAWMDDVGVDRAVVLPLESPESYPVPATTSWVLEETAPYPDRLLPFCSIDPRIEVYGEEPLEARLERYVDRGARGFGELKPGLRIDDERLDAVFELCAEHELPILFHTDEKAMVDAVGLPGLEDVLASFPDVDFLAHAHAWWAHVSADVTAADRGRYPDGPVEPGGRVPELLAEYDNCYGDISGQSGWNALTRDEAFGQAFLEAHHEQLLFGTDYLHPDQSVDHVALFERFDLDADAWADIRFRNLEGVLG